MHEQGAEKSGAVPSSQWEQQTQRPRGRSVAGELRKRARMAPVEAGAGDGGWHVGGWGAPRETSAGHSQLGLPMYV